MGLRLKKTKAALVPPEPSRLSRMSDEDIYLMLETALMGAQQRLTEYRGSPRDVRGALLAWLQSELMVAVAAATEMTHRW